MTSEERFEKIEEILLVQAGRLDMLTAQVAHVERQVGEIGRQVTRLVRTVVLGFTQRDERFRAATAETDEHLAEIGRRLDELDALVTPKA